MLFKNGRMIGGLESQLKGYPHQASAAASPLEYIVTLGNQFSSVAMYSSGDADAFAAADTRCG